jgi:hypothetical protein
MVRQTFQDQLAKIPAEERKKLLDEIHVQIQELVTGSRRLP